jgi:hypothetical protein
MREVLRLVVVRGDMPPKDWTKRIRNGCSLLHTAVLTGDMVMAALLLVSGADPNVVGRRGRLPIFDACELSYCNIAALLLLYGSKTPEANAQWTEQVASVLHAGARWKGGLENSCVRNVVARRVRDRTQPDDDEASILKLLGYATIANAMTNNWSRP